MAAIPPKPDINKMFIFDTNIVSFYFHDRVEDDVYYVDDSRLTLAATIKDQAGMCDALNEHLNRFFNSPQPIVVLDYTPNTAVAIKQLYESFKQESFGHFLFITFIHADEECRGLGFATYEEAIWQKYEYMNSFLLFPFISKIEIPPDYCIERDYLNRLFMAVHAFPLLPEISDEEWAAYAAKKQRRKTDRAL
jgi:hypothetical protein